MADSSVSVAFTGHRTYRGESDWALVNILRELFAGGYCTFLSGMAMGFDLAAAESVLRLRDECSGVRLICIIPFAGQELRYNSADRARYRKVLAVADEVEYLCDGYCPECYAKRNDRLVEQAAVVVAWYDGSPGGTRYTMQRARKSGLRLINLYESTQMQLF